MEIKLIVTLNKELMSLKFVDQKEITIGRDTSNTVAPLMVEGLSRRHARIFFEGDKWFVEDCGSTNGSYKMGVKLAERSELKALDLLQFGKLEVSIVSFGSADASAETSLPNAAASKTLVMSRPAPVNPLGVKKPAAPAVAPAAEKPAVPVVPAAEKKPAVTRLVKIEPIVDLPPVDSVKDLPPVEEVADLPSDAPAAAASPLSPITPVSKPGVRPALKPAIRPVLKSGAKPVLKTGLKLPPKPGLGAGLKLPPRPVLKTTLKKPVLPAK